MFNSCFRYKANINGLIFGEVKSMADLKSLADAIIKGDQNTAVEVTKAAIEEDRRQSALLKQLPEGSINNGDGTFTMPNGTIVEPE